MNILDKIKEWFEGKEEDNATPEPYNVGQQSYQRRVPDAGTQAQTEPRGVNPIPVDVTGIVPTWSMPSKHQNFKQTSLGTTRPGDVLSADYKWKRVTLWVTGVVAGQVATGVYIGTNEDLINNSIQGCQLPIDKPVIIEGLHTNLKFIQTAASIAANGALTINYIAERWAD